MGGCELDFVPAQHNEPHGFIQCKAVLIHPIVDNCFCLVRSGVWNIANKIVIVVKLLIHKAILKKAKYAY